jgi:hypothetical protein
MKTERTFGMTNPVYSNGMYDVVVGASEHSPETKYQIYKVVNRTTQVVEVEVSMIYRAIDFANELEKAYNAVLTGDVGGFEIVDLDDVETKISH